MFTKVSVKLLFCVVKEVWFFSSAAHVMVVRNVYFTGEGVSLKTSPICLSFFLFLIYLNIKKEEEERRTTEGRRGREEEKK
jgi:hypothetical protein